MVDLESPWPAAAALNPVRAQFEHKDQKSLEMSEMKAVRELLDSETSYTESLRCMLDRYYLPLRQNQFKLHPILCECDIDQIFLNVCAVLFLFFLEL